ncbi:MAG: helix-turn-helix domain-containing protein [Clostridium sp.]|nr:helix-turn-helix transcriptional regulator [Clostridium sp.]
MVGENLKRIRKTKKMTLKQLEEITGITNSYISAIENGRKKNPSTEILEKLAKALNVNVVDFYDKPVLTDRDKKDINKDLNEVMQEFRDGTDGTAYYNGIPLEESDLDLIESAMKIALEQIKIKNKEKYNPNKNK